MFNFAVLVSKVKIFWIGVFCNIKWGIFFWVFKFIIFIEGLILDIVIFFIGGVIVCGKKGGIWLGDGCFGRLGKLFFVSFEFGNSIFFWVVVVFFGGVKFFLGCIGEVGGFKGGGVILLGGGKLLGWGFWVIFFELIAVLRIIFWFVFWIILFLGGLFLFWMIICMLLVLICIIFIYFILGVGLFFWNLLFWGKVSWVFIMFVIKELFLLIEKILGRLWLLVIKMIFIFLFIEFNWIWVIWVIVKVGIWVIIMAVILVNSLLLNWICCCIFFILYWVFLLI